MSRHSRRRAELGEDDALYTNAAYKARRIAGSHIKLTVGQITAITTPQHSGIPQSAQQQQSRTIRYRMWNSFSKSCMAMATNAAGIAQTGCVTSVLVSGASRSPICALRYAGWQSVRHPVIDPTVQGPSRSLRMQMLLTPMQ